MNSAISKRIVESLPIKQNDRIIEVGPGMGALTKEIIKKDVVLTALEIDADLVIYLRTIFSGYPEGKIEILHVDSLDYIKGLEGKIPYIVSNLPYNISTDFVGTMLDLTGVDHTNNRFQGATIMFQKEFAERLIAEPGTKKYGRLSINFQLRMDHEKLLMVGRSNFKPAPRVDSMVISFKPRSIPYEDINDMNLFNRIVDNSFGNRRKMLKNTLEPRGLGLNFSIEELQDVLSSHGWLRSRPEELSISDLILLSNDLCQHQG